MRIGLISDTHIPGAAQSLPAQVAGAFDGVDLILHAGDVYLPFVLDELERIAPVLAASGDDDYGGTLSDERVKNKHVLEFDGRILWLVHESPFFYFMTRGRRALEENPPEDPHIIVHGHSHFANVREHVGILFVNPGSPTFPMYRVGLGTVAILTIEPDRVHAEIVQL